MKYLKLASVVFLSEYLLVVWIIAGYHMSLN